MGGGDLPLPLLLLPDLLHELGALPALPPPFAALDEGDGLLLRDGQQRLLQQLLLHHLGPTHGIAAERGGADYGVPTKD